MSESAPRTEHDESNEASTDAQVKQPSPVDQRVAEIAKMLKNLDQTASESQSTYHKPADPHENQLVQVRLGLASSLFAALRCKHGPTASHSLRVALGCSAWSLALRLPEAECDAIEVAALLHDVGKIGVPDALLMKPGQLTADEAAVMLLHREKSLEILRSCCASEEVLAIVQYASAWFDGSAAGVDCQGDDLPRGARMIAIVDAFDAMTTDQVYRPARSRERASAELFEFAGTQFDPYLVTQFAELHEANRFPQQEVSQRWLRSLSSGRESRMWRLNADDGPQQPASASDNALHFGQQLIENLHDGLVYVDSQLRIFHWNSGAERMTGIDGTAAESRLWTPALLELRNDKGSLIPETDCAVAEAVRTGMPSLDRLSISGRDGSDVTVDVNVLPIIGDDGTTHGATVLLHDVSSETTLEERCQDLQTRVTEDPLTKIANRAEFDRVHAAFITEHMESKVPCSLIICDIDRFKRINDNFGHQAGDDAIVSCVNVLKSQCRSGDLVARYGGEEFVVLCADCSNAAAARRAEQMRLALAETEQPTLGKERITASFGVTELQPGDSAETMLRRADRALLRAKDTGRNQVVQLGAGMLADKKRSSWWPFSTSAPPSGALIERQLVTEVPFKMALQKLCGFVADHGAEIAEVGDDFMNLVVQGSRGAPGERTVPLLVELKFSENRTENDENQPRRGHASTKVEVIIRLRRHRDSRHQRVTDQAHQMAISLQSYLMATDDTDNGDDNVLRKATRIIAPWRQNR